MRMRRRDFASCVEMVAMPSTRPVAPAACWARASAPHMGARNMTAATAAQIGLVTGLLRNWVTTNSDEIPIHRVDDEIAGAIYEVPVPWEDNRALRFERIKIGPKAANLYEVDRSPDFCRADLSKRVGCHTQR